MTMTKASRFSRFRLLTTTFVLAIAATLNVAWAQQLKDAPPIKNLDDLKQLSSKVVAMSERCVAATVCLMSPNGQGAGSGVIVNAEGLILTAAHVRAAIGDEVVVIFNDGTRKSGKSLGADNDRDAALVQLDDKGPFPYVEMGSSTELKRNQWCIAIGHAGGFDPTRTPPLRLGRILLNTRFITSDGAVVGGDSGGPLYDIEGNVIGIHSNIGASLSENRHVPIKAFRDYWDEMLKGETRGNKFNSQNAELNRTILGTELQAENEDGGVPISKIIPFSPAEKAGLKAGDIISGLNKKPTKTRENLISQVSKMKPGTKVTISVLRGKDEKEFEVTLGRLGDMLRRQQRNQQRPNNQRPKTDDQEKPDQKKPKSNDESKTDDKPKKKKTSLLPQLNHSRVYFTPDETKAPTKPEAKQKPRAPKAEKDELDKFLDKALKFKNGQMELKLNPKAIKKFGRDKILRRARQRAEKLNPNQRNGKRNQRPQTPDTFFMSALKALTDVTSKATESTVQVLVDGKAVALGTVATTDGLIITKNDETTDGKVSVKVGKKSHDAELIKRFPKRDLAVYRIGRDDLVPVEWVADNETSPVGSVLTIPDSQGQPLGIGLVSVQTRTMGKVGYLGVQMSDAEGGIRVERILPGGAAEKAGIKAGDLIIGLNGEKCDVPVDFSYRIRKLRAGDTIDLTYKRDEKEHSTKATLKARDLGGRAVGRARQMNEMSGPLSKVMGGFPEALQHDIPLSPAHCGGPLLNLDGKCVGINVSRAGRIKTFAVPASDIRNVLAEIDTLKADDKPPAKEAAAKQ